MIALGKQGLIFNVVLAVAPKYRFIVIEPVMVNFVSTFGHSVQIFGQILVWILM